MINLGKRGKGMMGKKQVIGVNLHKKYKNLENNILVPSC
jgi:hypothetical protein